MGGGNAVITYNGNPLYQLAVELWDKDGIYLNNAQGIGWNSISTICAKNARYLAVLIKRKDNGTITPLEIKQLKIKVSKGTDITPFCYSQEDIETLLNK